MNRRYSSIGEPIDGRTTRWLLALVLCCVPLLWPAAAQQCASGCQSRRAVLVELFYATGGPLWFNPWDVMGASVCLWDGILCSQERNDITALNLASNNLSGTLPIVLANLTALINIDVSSNQLRGALPTDLIKLSNLTTFIAVGNRLSGTIPDEYGPGFPAMSDFVVTDNFLNGTLPDSFRTWKQMNVFAVGNNSLEGTIPRSYGSSWPNVKMVQLFYNRLTGTLPTEISNWSEITSFSCYGNQLSGTLPVELVRWVNVRNVTMNVNLFTGTLPSEYTAWTNLEFFDVSTNRLHGTLPVAYRSFKSIVAMSFSRNLLEGSLPPEWGSMPGLKRLAWAENRKLTGTLPSSWAGMVGINLMVGANCSHTGTLPDSWKSLVLLEQLYLDLNALSGTLPPSWSAMRSLLFLSLSFNQFSGYLPAEWGRGLRLSVLNLQDNRKLTGTLPTAWFPMFSASFMFGMFSNCRTSLCGEAKDFTGLFIGRFLCVPEGVFPSWGVSSITEIMSEILPLAAPIAVLDNCPSNTVTESLGVVARPALANQYSEVVAAGPSAAAGTLVWASLAVSAVPRASTSGVLGAAGGIQGLFASHRARLRCTTADLGVDAVPPLADTVWDNPLHMHIDTLAPMYIFAGGAVIGNAVVVLVVGCALHVAAVHVAPWIKQRSYLSNTEKRTRSSREGLARGCTQMVLRVFMLGLAGAERLPGAMFGPYAVLVQPSIMSAWAMLSSPMQGTPQRDGELGGTCALGVASAILWTVPLGLWVFYLVVRLRPFPFITRSITLRLDKQPSCLPLRFRQWLQPKIAWACRPDSGTTVSSNRRSECARWMQTYGSLFTQYHHRRHWFLAVELANAWTVGMISGVTASAPDAAACAAADWCMWLMLVMCLLIMLAHVILRPLACPVEQLVATGTSMLIFVAQACVVFGEAEASMYIGMLASVAGAGVSLCMAALTFVNPLRGLGARCSLGDDPQLISLRNVTTSRGRGESHSSGKPGRARAVVAKQPLRLQHSNSSAEIVAGSGISQQDALRQLVQLACTTQRERKASSKGATPTPR